MTGRTTPPGGEERACETHSPGETELVGEALGRALRAREARGCVVALAGPLGAGKTCFVRVLARGLVVAGYVRSPTFTLIHEHRGPLPLYHVDLYRLKASELETLGLEDLVDGPGVTVIEWPDVGESVLPPEHLRVEIEFGRGEEDRVIRFVPRGGGYEEVVREVEACACSRSRPRPPS